MRGNCENDESNRRGSFTAPELQPNGNHSHSNVFPFAFAAYRSESRLWISLWGLPAFHWHDEWRGVIDPIYKYKLNK